MSSLMSIGALLCSAAIILMLGLGDPKRKRALGLGTFAQNSRFRRLWAIALILPGVVLLGLAEGAAFMIWLGGVGILGWFVTLALPHRSPVDRHK